MDEGLRGTLCAHFFSCGDQNDLYIYFGRDWSWIGPKLDTDTGPGPLNTDR